jgi:hypothetical protein
MRQLSVSEAAAVFGGDNPGMGPYAPPITQQDVTNFRDHLAALLAAGGGIAAFGGPVIGGLYGVGSVGLVYGLTSSFQQAAAEHNLRNGYDSTGTTYLWPSGVTPPTNTGFDTTQAQVVEIVAQSFGSDSGAAAAWLGDAFGVDSYGNLGPGGTFGFGNSLGGGSGEGSAGGGGGGGGGFLASQP